MTFVQNHHWHLLIAGLVRVIAVVTGVIVARDSGDEPNADSLAASDDLVGDTDEAQPVQHDPEYEAWLAENRDPAVPDLPFPDNPDPSQCGIPSQWSKDPRAWLNGYYEGKLYQAEVLLYDSHSRFRITASAPHGTEVQVVLYQVNPVVNYYMVKIIGEDGSTVGEGWIPEPFLSFEPVEPLPDGA
jgi:hypothetical protein